MLLFDPRTHPAAVILLAFVLAAGFLLVILSCALWNNWLPLLVGKSIFILVSCRDLPVFATSNGKRIDRTDYRQELIYSSDIRHGAST